MSYANIENKFFGRENILKHLNRRIIDLKDGYRQNVAIIGNRYVGKSSILEHFASNLDDDNVVIIYLNLENKDFNYMFSKFVGSLLYNFSKTKGLLLNDELNILLEMTKCYIPNTVQVINKIKSDIEKNKMAESFLGLMTLPEIFTNETGKFCILIFDEFQYIDNFQIPNAFQDLGKKIMTQKKCFYIMSSSFINIAQKILSEKLSLLFGNFETINIEPFNLEESNKFILHNLSNFRIGTQLVNFLSDFTGGHPLYLNLICREILSLSAMYRQEEIYLPLLSQAVENTLFDEWGVISRHFELINNDICSGKGNNIIASILISLSNNNHKINDLVNDIGIKKSQMMQKMNRLIDVGIIVKNSNFYYFKDKLFKYWIKFVYQKRLKTVELLQDKSRKQFKDEFNKHIDFFKGISRKDLSSRISDLLNCFDNDAFDLNGRKYKLPAFRNIENLKIRNNNGTYIDMLKASTIDSSWFIVMKKDNFGENDINIISQETKKLNKKPERCLIISLFDMDENAKVKALQERFWVWDRNEVNTLLTLFDKPYL